MKALQLFDEESLERTRGMSSEEILRFLEEFRLLYAAEYFALQSEREKESKYNSE